MGSYLPLTHSNHSMLRTLLALGVFLIPQVSSLGYWPYGGYGVHQAYQPFVRYQPVRFSPAHQYSAGRFYTPRQRYGEMHYGQQPYHGRYYARQPVRSYPGYSTRNIMY